MAKNKNDTSTTPQLTTASVLAFERKLDPLEGVFCAGRWEDKESSNGWLTIPVREKSVRGTISNRLKTKDADPQLDASIQCPTCRPWTLPLCLRTRYIACAFSLRILAGAGIPSACNDAAYQWKLLGTVKSYAETQGFTELAKRYAVNLVHGRFLWRNRIGAESIEVKVRQLRAGQPIQDSNFDAFALSLRKFDDRQDVNELGAVIAKGLSGNEHVLLEVIAHVRIGQGQEVFPSQELILDRGADKKGQKSKTLYCVKDAAAIHSQKIGNALRTIDTWYPECGDLGPIAVEPYGSVTSQGKAYRQPKQKVDFYSLLDAWVLRDEVPSADQQHFVMANLIRGGVFGESEKD